jgi:hypothetical protein
MKKIIILLTIVLSAAGCVTVQKHVPAETVKEVESKVLVRPGKQLQFKELNGYFLRTGVKLPQEINFFTVNSLNKLYSVLSVSRITPNVIDTPDFDKDIVVVIVMKPSPVSNVVAINEVYLIGSNIYIEYDIKSDVSKKLGYFVSNAKAFKIEKPKIITNVYFVDDRKNMTAVPFGNRSINSPESISDMLKNYTGIYKGVFPAAGEEKIFTELKLNPDYTYALKQKYLKVSDKIFASGGKCAPSGDLSFFILNGNKDLIFYFVDKTTIEKLNKNGEVINSRAYRLRK